MSAFNLSDLTSLRGAAVTPALLEAFAQQMKVALQLAENVPQYVMDDAEKFRQSVRTWAKELRDKESEAKTKKTA